MRKTLLVGPRRYIAIKFGLELIYSPLCVRPHKSYKYETLFVLGRVQLALGGLQTSLGGTITSKYKNVLKQDIHISQPIVLQELTMMKTVAQVASGQSSVLNTTCSSMDPSARDRSACERKSTKVLNATIIPM